MKRYYDDVANPIFPLTIVCLCLIVSGLVFVAPVQGVEPPEWLFDEPDAAEKIKNWNTNALLPLEIEEVIDQDSVERMALVTRSTGADPIIYLGGAADQVDYEPFSGEEYHILYLGIRVNTPNRWEIYFVSEEDPDWSEKQKVIFDVNAENKFEDLEIELKVPDALKDILGDWQSRTILRFRIDPGTKKDIKAEIDYISFKGKPAPEAVNPYATLVTTWARIRR